ncbi:MAG TPA: DUF3515 family protein [Mycobacteriales bacterium]|nr:DUF3515 family protein [Mycobacteriales bacterium]
MPRRPPVGLLAVALVAACGGGRPLAPVPVQPVATLSARQVATCGAVSAKLPDEIALAVARRSTDPDSPGTAAWGDPPIVLRCGVATGSARDDAYEFDGVRWAMHDTGATRTWTTLSRPVSVQVVIPDSYRNQAEILGALAGALAPTAG